MSVNCKSCGMEIEDGWERWVNTSREGDDVAICETGEYFCEDCWGLAERPCYLGKFRTCGRCGQPMNNGFMVEDGSWYCCEDCFESCMDEDYPDGWRENAHDDSPLWGDGYYDFVGNDGQWHDTGVFYTEWF